ncbi:hypothetical protein MTO96_037861, partial [Rhipicephalus appendiculatus]
DVRVNTHPPSSVIYVGVAFRKSCSCGEFCNWW